MAKKRHMPGNKAARRLKANILTKALPSPADMDILEYNGHGYRSGTMAIKTPAQYQHLEPRPGSNYRQ